MARKRESRLVDRARDHLIARVFLDGDALARDHALVNRAAAVDNRAVDGHLIARLQDHHVTDQDLSHWQLDDGPSRSTLAR